jgi:hypothetical protein
MIVFTQPKATVLYDYESLAYFISVWRSAEASESWIGTGFAPCAPIHRQAVSSRQWDSAAGLVDDELEKNTAILIGECIDNLEPIDRALVMYGQCLVDCTWVRDMLPERAQLRYEAALLNLALMARRAGVDV